MTGGRGHLLPSPLSLSPEGICWVHPSLAVTSLLWCYIPSLARVYPTSSAEGTPQIMNASRPTLGSSGKSGQSPCPSGVMETLGQAGDSPSRPPAAISEALAT